MAAFNFTPFPNLETERLILRELKDTDADILFNLRSDPDINKYIGNRKPSSIDEIHELIATINKGISNNESIFWVLESKDTKLFAGTICIWHLSLEKSSGELGYTLLQPYQGKA